MLITLRHFNQYVGRAGGDNFVLVESLLLLSSLTNNSWEVLSSTNLLDKPWSQVSSLLPSGTYLHVLSRRGFSIPTARRCLSSVSNSRSRAFR